jgi:hypothetical protein
MGRRPVQQGREPEIILSGELDLVTVFLLPDQGKDQTQQGRKGLLDVGDDDVTDLCLSSNAVNPLVEGAEHDDRRNARIVQLVLQLVGCVQEVAGHDDAAGQHGPIVGDDELRTVGGNDRHPIPLLDAELLEAGSKVIDCTVERPIAHGAVHEPRAYGSAENDSWSFGVFGCRVGQELIEGNGRVVYGGRHAFVIRLQPYLAMTCCCFHFHLLMHRPGSTRTRNVP